MSDRTLRGELERIAGIWEEAAAHQYKCIKEAEDRVAWHQGQHSVLMSNASQLRRLLDAR